MTKINRNALESSIINSLLTILRAGLTDVYIPVRTGTNWIRSSMKVTEPSTSAESVGRKKYIIKEASKPNFPQVIVQDFVERNVTNTFINGKINYEVECEVTIRVLDIGGVSRIGGLASQISDLLVTKKATDLRTAGISKLEYDVISLPGYADDDNDYNEKDISLRFTARLSEWQGPQ
jgi:hypothetical protein